MRSTHVAPQGTVPAAHVPPSGRRPPSGLIPPSVVLASEAASGEIASGALPSFAGPSALVTSLLASSEAASEASSNTRGVRPPHAESDRAERSKETAVAQDPAEARVIDAAGNARAVPVLD